MKLKADRLAATHCIWPWKSRLRGWQGGNSMGSRVTIPWQSSRRTAGEICDPENVSKNCPTPLQRGEVGCMLEYRSPVSLVSATFLCETSTCCSSRSYFTDSGFIYMLFADTWFDWGGTHENTSECWKEIISADSCPSVSSAHWTELNAGAVFQFCINMSFVSFKWNVSPLLLYPMVILLWNNLRNDLTFSKRLFFFCP